MRKEEQADEKTNLCKVAETEYEPTCVKPANLSSGSKNAITSFAKASIVNTNNL